MRTSRRVRLTCDAASAVELLVDLFLGGDIDASSSKLLADHLGGTTHFDFDQAAEDGRLAGTAYLAMTMPLFQLA